MFKQSYPRINCLALYATNSMSLAGAKSYLRINSLALANKRSWFFFIYTCISPVFITSIQYLSTKNCEYLFADVRPAMPNVS